MPILRYFAVVGVSLLALLFLTGAYLPRSAYEPDGFQIDKSTIRITSHVRTPPPVIISATEGDGSF